MNEAADRLRRRLAETEQQLTDLARVHEQIVSASRDSNADDEHDPEGATIAFERQQVVALTQQAERTRTDLLRALDLVEQGAYGVCELCAGPVGDERLEARPAARRCVACASRR